MTKITDLDLDSFRSTVQGEGTVIIDFWAACRSERVRVVDAL